MNKLKTKQRIKILFAILVSFSATTLISPSLFVADSPEINRQFIADIVNAPANTVAKIRYANLNSQEKEVEDLKELSIPPEDTPEDLNYYPMAQGVEAAEHETENGKETYIKLKKGSKFKVQTITLDDGEKVKVYIPQE